MENASRHGWMGDVGDAAKLGWVRDLDDASS